jgi:GNAT superfamily N-acetyltransferase
VEGAEIIPRLEPLYLTLQEHQRSVAPELGGMPARSVEDAWALRSAEYRGWLAEPGAFVVLAERNEDIIGYALVSLASGYQGWISAERIGEVIDVVVAPKERGSGIGGDLLDVVERRLADVGIEHLRLRVLAANVDALRLYERRGMQVVSKILLRPI